MGVLAVGMKAAPPQRITGNTGQGMWICIIHETRLELHFLNAGKEMKQGEVNGHIGYNTALKERIQEKISSVLPQCSYRRCVYMSVNFT